MGHSESKPGATVLANVKTVTKPDSQWHEPVYYALCASGGGSRALTYTMGIYRGLNELNLIPKLDAISSVSGGTWCSSIFVFAKTFKGEEVSTGQLVGAPVQPSSLSMTELESTTVGAIASGIVLGDSDEILAKTGMEFIGREWETWPHVMSRWLLRDFDGVKDMNAYLALDDDSIQRIKKNNPQLEKKTFITPRSDRPKMYIINGTMLAPLDKLATNENVVTFQMGADYIGSPFYPDNQQVSYHRASFCPNGCECMYSKCGDVTRTVGGGFVESFAFGGTAPTERLLYRELLFQNSLTLKEKTSNIQRAPGGIRALDRGGAEGSESASDPNLSISLQQLHPPSRANPWLTEAPPSRPCVAPRIGEGSGQ